MQPALSIYVQYLSQYLACYEKGSKVEDMQIHRVWANASRVYDLRWIQFQGDLHKALGKHREEHVNPLLKLGRRDWQLNSQARETENNMNNLGQQSQFLEILTKRELGWEGQIAYPSQHQVFCVLLEPAPPVHQPRASTLCCPGQLFLAHLWRMHQQSNAYITETWVIISQLFHISFLR